MNYSLNAGEWSSVFAVPSSVVDKYIKLASGDALKLLLFLLRHGGKIFSENELKEALGFRKTGELEDAAVFWVQRGIIRADNGSLTAAADDVSVQETLPEITTEPAAPKVASSVRRINDESAAIYTSTDIAGRIQSDPAINYLFTEAQALYGRMLKQPESRMVLMLVDHYGLPAEVAAMLLKYCFKVEHTTPSYIQAVAQSWADDGINNIAEADRCLAKLEKRHLIEEQLRSAMELKTKFSQKQLNFIKKWSEEWSFNADMIMLAYELTLDNTGGMNFSYTNKILENWNAAGICTVDAAKAENASGKRSAKTAKSETASSFDVGDVMEDIIQKYRS